MSHHYQRTACKAGADTLKQKLLGGRVKGGGRLIQQDDAARTQQRSRYGDALRLAFAEAGPLLAAERVEALGKVEDELCYSRVERLAHLLLGGVRLAHLKVVADGSAYEGVALRDVYYVAPSAR